ncbi:hypothetical protein Q9L58_010960, partial [Maublancomyces gigas]
SAQLLSTLWEENPYHITVARRSDLACDRRKSSKIPPPKTALKSSLPPPAMTAQRPHTFAGVSSQANLLEHDHTVQKAYGGIRQETVFRNSTLRA